MFTNNQLRNLIIPLVLEQFLVMLVGLVDTFVVSYAGAALYRSVGKTSTTMYISDLSNQTKHLVVWLVLIHNIANAIIYPFAGPLGKGLRAAGDVRFTMAISILTTIGVRLVLSILFGIVLNLGVIGIALAMCMEWLARAVIFFIRYKQGKWKTFQLI